MAQYERILIAVDFSEHSRRAVEVGIDFAKKLGSKVDLVHAFELPLPALTPYDVVLPDQFIELTEQMERVATAVGRSFERGPREAVVV